MKLIQKILSHGLMITIIAAAALVYFYRAEIFPHWIGSDKQSGKPAPAVAEPAPELAAEPVTRSGSQAGPVVESAPVEEPKVAPVAEPAAAVAAKSSAGLPPMAGSGQTLGPQTTDSPELPPLATGLPRTASVPESAQQQSSTELPVMKESGTDARYRALDEREQASASDAGAGHQWKPIADTETPVTQQVAAPVEDTMPALVTETTTDTVRQPVVSTGQETSMDAEPSTVEALLAKAREAYWRRDVDAAEQAYLEAGELAPSLPGIWGELGNLYFSEGSWKQAAEAYFRAAQGFIDIGEPARASGLLKVIRGLDTEKANALELRLSGNNG